MLYTVGNVLEKPFQRCVIHPKKFRIAVAKWKRKSAIVYRLQMRVVKKTTMKKRLWFFFAMFSTSACNSYLTKFNQNDVRSNRVSFRRVPLMSWMQCTLLRHQRLWFNFCQIQHPSPISFVVIKLPMDGSQAWQGMWVFFSCYLVHFSCSSPSFTN